MTFRSQIQTVENSGAAQRENPVVRDGRCRARSFARNRRGVASLVAVRPQFVPARQIIADDQLIVTALFLRDRAAAWMAKPDHAEPTAWRQSSCGGNFFQSRTSCGPDNLPSRVGPEKLRIAVGDFWRTQRSLRPHCARSKRFAAASIATRRWETNHRHTGDSQTGPAECDDSDGTNENRPARPRRPAGTEQHPKRGHQRGPPSRRLRCESICPAAGHRGSPKSRSRLWRSGPQR